MSDTSDRVFSGHARGSAEYRRLLAGLFFAGIATFAQLYSPQAVLPSIARRFDVDAATAALVVSASTIGLAAGVIPWSIVADRIGRVRAMAIGVIAATTIGLAVPFSPDFSLLLGARVLEGAMVGSVPAIAIAYLTEEVHASAAARATGTYVAGTTIGGLAGRVIAGPIADVGDWRIGVFVVALICAAAAVMFLVLVPAAHGFVPFRQRVSAGPSIRMRLLANVRSPAELAIYAEGFLVMGSFVAVYNFLGFRLAAAPFGLPPIVISLLFVAYLAGTVSSTRAGALASRLGRRPVLILAISVTVGGVLLMLVPTPVVVIVGLLVFTAGFFAAHAMSSGWAPAAAPMGRAQASSLYTLAYYGGSSVVGWAGGLVFVAAGWGGLSAVVLALSVVAVVIAAAALRRAPSGDAPTALALA